MRITTVLRRVSGVTQRFVKQVQLSVTGALTVSVVPAWRRSRCRSRGRKAPRDVRQAGAGVASPAVGPDAGVVAVCAVAGGLRPLRGAGRAGVVGGGFERIHGAVRRADGVSGADDGPDDREPAGGDFVAGGRQHRRTRGGAAFGRGAVRRADPHRHRRVQLPETPPLRDGGGRPRPPAGGLGRRGGAVPGRCTRSSTVWTPTAARGSRW